MLAANSRSPENVRGDLNAQVAACRRGEERLAAVHRIGDTVLGARPDKDGIDVTDHDICNVYHVPVEMTEGELPVRYRRLELWQDSGGAGTWRGGLGYRAEVEWLTHRGTVSLRRERHKFGPWGTAGGAGRPGLPHRHRAGRRHAGRASGQDSGRRRARRRAALLDHGRRRPRSATAAGPATGACRCAGRAGLQGGCPC